MGNRIASNRERAFGRVNPGSIRVAKDLLGAALEPECHLRADRVPGASHPDRRGKHFAQTEQAVSLQPEHPAIPRTRQVRLVNPSLSVSRPVISERRLATDRSNAVQTGYLSSRSFEVETPCPAAEHARKPRFNYAQNTGNRNCRIGRGPAQQERLDPSLGGHPVGRHHSLHVIART